MNIYSHFFLRVLFTLSFSSMIHFALLLCIYIERERLQIYSSEYRHLIVQTAQFEKIMSFSLWHLWFLQRNYLFILLRIPCMWYHFSLVIFKVSSLSLLSIWLWWFSGGPFGMYSAWNLLSFWICTLTFFNKLKKIESLFFEKSFFFSYYSLHMFTYISYDTLFY